MADCTLVIDDREQAVSPFIPRNNIPYITNRITTGDFAIIRNNYILAIFERKTLADFASSIKDMRNESQIRNMLEIQKKFPGCQIYYIIEGRAFPAQDDKFDRIPYSTISSSINTLEVVHDVKIIKSKDCEDTALKLAEKIKCFNKHWKDIEARYKPIEIQLTLPEWSFELMYVLKYLLDNPEVSEEDLINSCGCVYEKAKCAENFKELSDNIRQKNDEVIKKLEIIEEQWKEITADNTLPEAKDELTKCKNKSITECKLTAWISLPGVSNLIAPLLTNKLSLKSYVKKEIKAEDLSGFKYPSGKNFTKNIIETIVSGPDHKLEVKLLKCIPGMGNKAETLLTDRSLKDLVDLDVDQLALIKVGKNNLGPVKASEILALFS